MPNGVLCTFLAPPFLASDVASSCARRCGPDRAAAIRHLRRVGPRPAPPRRPGLLAGGVRRRDLLFGDAEFFGSTGGVKLNRPIVGWPPPRRATVTGWSPSDGGIFAFGDAAFFGSTGGISSTSRSSAWPRRPSGKGYWLVASDGGIFAFGDAAFLGSTGGIKLNQPIVGMASTTHGQGLLAGGLRRRDLLLRRRRLPRLDRRVKLNQPIVGHGGHAVGQGLLAGRRRRGIFAFGDAVALGAATALRSVAAMAPTTSGAGYWAVGADGALATFGYAVDLGHPTGALTKPIVGMAVLPPRGPPDSTTSPTSNDVSSSSTPPPATAPPVPPAPAIQYPLFLSSPSPARTARRPRSTTTPAIPSGMPTSRPATWPTGRTPGTPRSSVRWPGLATGFSSAGSSSRG